MLFFATNMYTHAEAGKVLRTCMHLRTYIVLIYLRLRILKGHNLHVLYLAFVICTLGQGVCIFCVFGSKLHVYIYRMQELFCITQINSDCIYSHHTNVYIFHERPVLIYYALGVLML